MDSRKRILLVDVKDIRRETRVRMLVGAGYEVETRPDEEVSETLDNEGSFDLLIVALHNGNLEDAVSYSERVRRQKPDLPILLLLDAGVFVPRGTLNPSIETASPVEMMKEIAKMLAESDHIRELPDDVVPV